MAIFTSCMKNYDAPKSGKADRYQIQYKKGDKYLSTLKLHQKSLMFNCDDKFSTLIESEYFQEYEVLDVDEDGSGLIKVTFLNVIMNAKSDDEKRNVSFNAKSPKLPEDLKDDDLFDIFAEMVGEHISLKISPKGRVVEVLGVKERNDRITKKIKARNEGFKPSWYFKEGLLFSEDVEIEAFEGYWRFLPEGPHVKTKTWTKEYKVHSGRNYIYEIELLKRNAKSSTYGVAMNYDSEIDKKYRPKNDDFEYNFKNRTETRFVVDTKSNWPVLIDANYETVGRWKSPCAKNESKEDGQTIEGYSVTKIKKVN